MNQRKQLRLLFLCVMLVYNFPFSGVYGIEGGMDSDDPWEIITVEKKSLLQQTWVVSLKKKKEIFDTSAPGYLCSFLLS